MKKRVLAIFLFIMMIATSFTVCIAQTKVIEVPEVKILLNGKQITFEDVTLSISNRTMLPLRAVLVELGVINDDQHIIWDNTEKSVTIIKDSTTIYLKQGSTVATVNGENKTLDAAPILYSKNNRIYIPVRFISQALGYDVDWDGITSTVTIDSPSEGKTGIIGSWENYQAVVNVSLTSNLVLNSNYTFSYMIVTYTSSGSYSATSFEGKYKIEGNTLTFYNQLKGTATASNSSSFDSMIENIPVADKINQFEIIDEITLSFNEVSYTRVK